MAKTTKDGLIFLDVIPGTDLCAVYDHMYNTIELHRDGVFGNLVVTLTCSVLARLLDLARLKREAQNGAKDPDSTP